MVYCFGGWFLRNKRSKEEKALRIIFFFGTYKQSGYLCTPTSRSRAAVARRAHNPKVGSSILPFATKEKAIRLWSGGLFNFFVTVVFQLPRLITSSIQGAACSGSQVEAYGFKLFNEIRVCKYFRTS